MLRRIVSGVMIALLLLTMSTLVFNTIQVKGSSPICVRRFRLLAIEQMFDSSRMKSAQFLIEELLRYPNWNNSTDQYVSYIHFLSLYNYSEVDDAVKNFWQGTLSMDKIENEIVDFLGQATPGEIVIFYYNGHSGLMHWLSSGSKLNRWLMSGGLPQALVIVVFDTCGAAYVIKTELLPDNIVLAACKWDQVAYGGWWNNGPCGIFTIGFLEGFHMANESNNDGWISTAEVFSYAKNYTESFVTWTDQNPQSYYGKVEGDLPLVPRDITEPFPTWDTAIIYMQANPLRVEPGFPVEINITVENQGAKPATFDVSVYSNSSLITIQQVTLDSGVNTTLIFAWNTTGFYGTYIISVAASISPGEIDTVDNSCTIDEIVNVAYRFDLNADGKVNVQDITVATNAFGSSPSRPRWNPRADVNHDFKVRVDDILAIALNFGWSKP